MPTETPHPDVQERDMALAELTAKCASLDLQIEALQDTAKEKRRDLREAFRTSHEKRFADVDYKRALVGAKTEHAVTVKDVVSFFVRPPTAATIHTIDKFVAAPMDVTDPKNPTDVGPISEAEHMVLAWVIGVHLLADPSAKRQEIEPLGCSQRLRMARGLPADLIRRVAEECNLMQSWLNVVLEIELGNF